MARQPKETMTTPDPTTGTAMELIPAPETPPDPAGLVTDNTTGPAIIDILAGSDAEFTAQLATVTGPLTPFTFYGYVFQAALDEPVLSHVYAFNDADLYDAFFKLFHTDHRGEPLAIVHLENMEVKFENLSTRIAEDVIQQVTDFPDTSFDARLVAKAVAIENEMGRTDYRKARTRLQKLIAAGHD